MSEVIETPRAKMVRLVGEAGCDDVVALASVQALVDLLLPQGHFTQEQFYDAVSARLKQRYEGEIDGRHSDQTRA